GLFRVMSPLPENGDVSERRLTFAEGLQATGRMFRYRSQWRSFFGLGPGAAARFLLGRREALQFVQPSRVQQRPHRGELLYEARYQVSFQTISEALAAAGMSS